jgi:hypothetical protein
MLTVLEMEQRRSVNRDSAFPAQTFAVDVCGRRGFRSLTAVTDRAIVPQTDRLSRTGRRP